MNMSFFDISWPVQKWLAYFLMLKTYKEPFEMKEVSDPDDPDHGTLYLYVNNVKIGYIYILGFKGTSHEDLVTHKEVKDSEQECIEIRVTHPNSLLTNPRYSFSVGIVDLENLIFTPLNNRICGDGFDIGAFRVALNEYRNLKKVNKLC